MMLTRAQVLVAIALVAVTIATTGVAASPGRTVYRALSNKPRDPSLTYETFRSPAVPLKSGQVANTPNSFGPMPFVKGPVAVRHFEARVIDDDNNTVPLDEVYCHHWLIFDDGGMHKSTINDGLCPGLANVWGIGAELLGTKYDYPEGYAIVTTGKEQWTANIHLIRTTNVPDVQMCIECHCKWGTPANPEGDIACCPDRTQCWGMDKWTKNDTKNYYLEYTGGSKRQVPPTVGPFFLSFSSAFSTCLHVRDLCLQRGTAHSSFELQL
eukprot:m.6838 g.6838  ORF g.6838 m.6838 type:complete len:268 (-) comp2748_c0_seq1:329-1132(-)